MRIIRPIRNLIDSWIATIRRGEVPRVEEWLILGQGSYSGSGAARVVGYAGNADERVTVGAFCSIAPDVTFVVGGGHHTDWLSTYPFEVAFGRGHPVSKGPITIGNDVWIGMESLIMSGVNVGDGAVIAARSVITRDVPPYTIVAGSPGRVVRTRFCKEDVAALLYLRWWDWPPAIVWEAAPILTGGSIDDLKRFAAVHGLPTGSAWA